MAKGKRVPKVGKVPSPKATVGKVTSPATRKVSYTSGK